MPVTLAEVQSTILRLFIGSAVQEGASLRKEDTKKALELTALLRFLPRLEGGHLVDAAAGKSSVGLVAAEHLPIARLTVLERDPTRIEACRVASRSVRAGVAIDVRLTDVASSEAWPDKPDAVVALHACGGAADLVIEGAIACQTRQLFLVPCCYGKSVAFREAAIRAVSAQTFVADDVLRRRIVASYIELERKLRLEAAGYETDIEEFVAPTVTPHNLLHVARLTRSEVRIARAKKRLADLYAAAT